MSPCIILLFLFPLLLRAGDEKSWLHTMRHSQFPFDSLNTTEKQAEFTDQVLQEPICDLIAGGPSQYDKILLRALYAGRVYNNRQEILNTKANEAFWGGVPCMIHPATRRFGAGLWCAAFGLKINSMLYLPHVDGDQIRYRLSKVRNMSQTVTDLEQLIQSLDAIERQQQQINSRNNGSNESI